MNLRQLEHLAALAEEGTFARAAERVHLSQPALTRSIQMLEEELGLPLFDRHPRGATLTEGGALVLQRTQRVLFEAQALGRDVALFKNHDLGDARFGMGPYPTAALMADVLADLSSAHPLLSLSAVTNNWTVLEQQLRAEQIDFFVVERRGVPQVADLSVQPLSSHVCHWYARPQHPVFKARKPPLLNVLRNVQLASVPLPAHMREEMRKALGFKPADALQFQVECNNFHPLKELAQRSDTVIYSPPSAVAGEVQRGVLRQLEFADSRGFALQFAIVHLAHRTVSPNAQRAMDAVVACDRRLSQAAA